MTLAPRLNLSQNQRIALTPMMRKTLEILRLPAVELEHTIETELRENPFLVRRKTDAKGPIGVVALDSDLVSAPRLLERLHWQIGLMPLTPQVRAMAEYLAAELRDDGYLDVPLDEIAKDVGAPIDAAEAALAALQRCDPPGIGARDLAECLVLQLMDRAELSRALATAAVARLEDFAAGKVQELSLSLGIDQGTAARIATELPNLAACAVSDSAVPVQILRADLVARRAADGEIRIELARSTAPRLKIDTGLWDHADLQGDLAAEWRARAETLVAALQFRSETLLRIGRHIAGIQAEALGGKFDALRPLSRREVAAALGLHPSTVGRAVASKAIEIDGRLRLLSDFFSSPVPGVDGAAVSAHVVRRRIVEIVAAERPDAPLSDARLCAMLNSEGVDIARRTVTKYRQWMRVPSSSVRRRLAINRRLRATRGAIPKD